MREPTIVPMGGGGFSMEPDNPLLDDYLLSLVQEGAPRICFVPTASGDSDSYIVRFYQAFAHRPCRPCHLALFRDRPARLERFVMEQDILYVGGGNTVNLLAVWRAHGLDAIVRRAWADGVILTGLSAGSLCWFEGGTTDSFGGLDPLNDGLGFLPGSHSPHYDGEPGRRPRYQQLVAGGRLPPGIAADDGVAIRYQGTERVEVVSSRREARAWLVARQGDGAVEQELMPRFLGA